MSKKRKAATSEPVIDLLESRPGITSETGGLVSAHPLVEVIQQKDGQWCVVSEDGTRTFGCYATKEEAEERLRQVKFFKRAASGITLGESGSAPSVQISEHLPGQHDQGDHSGGGGGGSKDTESGIRTAIEDSDQKVEDAFRQLNRALVGPRSSGGNTPIERYKDQMKAVDRIHSAIGDVENGARELGVSMDNLNDSLERLEDAIGTGDQIAVASAQNEVGDAWNLMVGRMNDAIDARRESLSITESSLATVEALDLREARGKTGRQWAVTIIKAGISKNGLMYRPEVLKAAVPLFEGAKVCEFEFPAGMRLPAGVKDHPDKMVEHIAGIVGAMANTVGWIDGVTWNEDTQALEGMLNIADPIRAAKYKAFHEAGRGIPALSIRAVGPAMNAIGPSGPYLDVQKIASVKAVDIVDFPAAGGNIERLVASTTPNEEDQQMKDQVLAFLRRVAPKAVPTGRVSEKDLLRLVESAQAKVDLKAFREADDASAVLEWLAQLAALLRDEKLEDAKNLLDEIVAKVASMEKPSEEKAEHAAPAMEGVAAAVEAKLAEADAKIKSLEAHLASEARERVLARAEDRIKATRLPEPVKADLKESIREIANPTDETVAKAIDRAIKSWGAVSQAGEVRLQESARASGITVTASSMDKVRGALYGYFGVKGEGSDPTTGQELKTLLESAKPFRRFREAYQILTGDESVSGRFNRPGLLVDADLREAITTTTLPELVLDAMNIRAVQEYRMTPAPWRRIAKVVSVEDFRAQHITRWGGFASLPVVPENNPYAALADPASEEVTYTPSKRGALVEVTREMILGNRDRDIKQIPVRIGRAAARTLTQFVCDLLVGWDGAVINGANIYDGNPLYDAAHSNTSALALTYDNLNTAIDAMLNQTELSSGEPLALRPHTLVVPIELRATAENILLSKVEPGTQADVNSVAGIIPGDGLMVLHRAFLRNDTDNWYLVANPADGETIEIGFVEGQEEPAIFLQDGPTLGNVFTADRITFKARHEYGGAVVDFRTLYGALV